MNYNLSVEHHSEYNSPIDLVLHTGTFNVGDFISTNFRLADAPKQNFFMAEEKYQEMLNWWSNQSIEPYRNGEKLLYELNLTVEMKSDGTVHVETDYQSLNENITSLHMFEAMAWKFGCFEFRKSNGFSTNRCPENNTDLNTILYDFSKEEVKLRNRSIPKFTYSIPYLLVDNKTGDLSTYTNDFTKSEEDESFKQARLKLSSIFYILPYEKDRAKTKFDVDFGYTGTSHCIKFAVYRYNNSTINVTMLSPIENYTLPSNFNVESLSGNNLVAKRACPCETTSGMQEVEVCSI
jgi:hypothetical protein